VRWRGLAEAKISDGPVSYREQFDAETKWQLCNPVMVAM